MKFLPLPTESVYRTTNKEHIFPTKNLLAEQLLQPPLQVLTSCVLIFQVNEDLQALLKKKGIALIAANSFVDNPDNVIKDLKVSSSNFSPNGLTCTHDLCLSFSGKGRSSHYFFDVRGQM